MSPCDEARVESITASFVSFGSFLSVAAKYSCRFPRPKSSCRCKESGLRQRQKGQKKLYRQILPQATTRCLVWISNWLGFNEPIYKLDLREPEHIK